MDVSNPTEQQESLSPRLAQLLLYPVLSQLTAMSQSPPPVPSEEKTDYQEGFDDGYHFATTAKPAMCTLFSNCKNTPAYNADFQAGITAAGNAINSGGVPPPPIGEDGSNFNPYGGFD